MDLLILGIVVLIYFLLVGYVGYVAWRRTETSEDYMVPVEGPIPTSWP